jgi:hypothetical protein
LLDVELRPPTDANAFSIAAGSVVLGGRARLRPEKTRIVNRPERGVPSAGRGVVGRDGVGVSLCAGVSESFDSLLGVSKFLARSVCDIEDD